MTRTRRTLQKLVRLESMLAVIPPSLEEAFAEIERPAPRYSDAPEARANTPRTAQDARSNA